MIFYRGNHESALLNMRAGFYRELSRKYDDVFLFGLFSEVFCWMPVAHLIEGRILVVHGGISGRKDFRVDDIRRIKLVFIHETFEDTVSYLLRTVGIFLSQAPG